MRFCLMVRSASLPVCRPTRSWQETGLGPIGWHTLRHSYRAWLGDNGEPLTVQKELMRHASIETTLNTYGGGMMDSMREAHGRVVKQAMAR